MANKNMEDNNDLRLRGGTVVDMGSEPGTIYPFSTPSGSLMHTLQKEFVSVISETQGKKIAAYLVANVLCTVVLLIWCNSTNSMALTAFSYLTIFDIFSLLSCLVTFWVQKQKASPMFSFGYGRFEVLTVFASTILAQQGALFIVKESIERMVMQPEVHTGRLLVGTLFAFLFHMLVTYGVDNKAFNHVVAASSSSWLQEHVADMSESLCHMVPGLSKMLLPRINPFALIAFGGGFALVAVYILIDMNNYYASDTWAAVWIALMTCGTMFPMSVYSGKILLQTTPSHIIGQLDKVLREASTLDGVLEFRHEHFWTLAFGTMAGSVHVRIRRDADEQLVLAHVVNRLSNLINLLTVQVFKDDWTRASAYQIIADTSILSKLPGSGNSPIRLPLGNADPNSVLNNVGKLQRSPLGLPQGGLPYPNVASIPNSMPPYTSMAPGLGPIKGLSPLKSTNKMYPSPLNPSYIPSPPSTTPNFSRTPGPMLAQTYGVDLAPDHTGRPSSGIPHVIPSTQTSYSHTK